MLFPGVGTFRRIGAPAGWAKWNESIETPVLDLRWLPESVQAQPVLTLWAVPSSLRAQIGNLLRTAIAEEATSWVEDALWHQGEAWRLTDHDVQWAWTKTGFRRDDRR